jgi:zinc transport system substrate-binding protein
MTGMKRPLFPSILLLAVCALANPGCGPAEKKSAGDRLRVVVSILPQVEFAEKVGGDRVEVSCMIPPGAEPHEYEPKPSQLTGLSSARLYIQVGSGIAFEQVWMERMRSINAEMPVIDSAEGIETIGADPHVWLSPRHAQTMVGNICRGLVQVDPTHRDHYERNRDLYLEELKILDEQLGRNLADAGVKRFMVYHPSWGYFARAYGLEQLAVEAEGKEPTIQGLAKLVRRARELGVDAVFVEPQFAGRSARTIAAEIGARVLPLDPLPRHYADQLRHFVAQLTQNGS